MNVIPFDRCRSEVALRVSQRAVERARETVDANKRMRLAAKADAFRAMALEAF